MRGGVAGVGADGLFQHLDCLAVLSPEGINDRQIVIGLGQRGMVLGQRGKQPDGLIVFFLLSRNHCLQKPQLHITAVFFELGLYTLGGSAELPFFHQLLHFINGSRACMCPPMAE